MRVAIVNNGHPFSLKLTEDKKQIVEVLKEIPIPE